MDKNIKRIETEKKTIDKMIRIYCSLNHNSKEKLCGGCEELHNYAFQRLLHCPFGENKPVCSECEIHCYKSEMREKIKEVMRFSGPRMIYKHPYLAVLHIFHKKNNKI